MVDTVNLLHQATVRVESSDLVQYRFVGHQKFDEKPWCEVSLDNWQPSQKVAFDVNDKLNKRDSPNGIDRHDCTLSDVDGDGEDDVICVVGANKGKGKGYTELYMTQPDGLRKIIGNHGLKDYPSMRTRLVTELHGREGSKYIFIATLGLARSDGKENVHRMFKNVFTTMEKKPYFKEVQGPWQRLSQAVCGVAADWDSDKRDDLIVCNEDGPPFLFKQVKNDEWKQIKLRKSKYLFNWRNVRVEDITGGPVPDLVVVGGRNKGWVRVFKGIKKFPYFDFSKPIFERYFPFQTPDVEILDVNGDGIKDLYVIQVDRREGKYCAYSGGSVNKWWGGGTQPAASWIPPLDEAPDFLFVGQGFNSNNQIEFTPYKLSHRFPGCGSLARKYGADGKSLVLAQGDHSHAGHNILLKW